MSLHLEFEPHSWYMGFAIRKWDGEGYKTHFNAENYSWEAYTDDGNTYSIVKLQADTLKELKQRIKEYHRQEAERQAEIYRRLEQKK